MKKAEFYIGVSIESDTEYFAKEKLYHVYSKDAVTVSDPRYVALRANDTAEFESFILLKGKKNVTLDFGGATLLIHGKIQPFIIDSCENIKIKNCKVTYERPPYTQALIKEATPQWARLRLSDNCPCRIEDEKLIPYGDGWENRRLNYNGSFYQVFDPKTQRGCGLHLGAMGSEIIMEYERPFTIRHFTVRKDGEDILLLGDIPSFYQPGRILVITHEARSLSNVFLIDSKDIFLENYRILSGRGMGLYSYRSENISLDGFCLDFDEESPCVVSNAADAVHTFGTSGRFEIKNSVFKGMIDDAINIHSNFRTVEHASGKEIYTHLASCEKTAADLYRVGDEIALYKGKTMQECARYVIEKIETVDSDVKKFTVDREVSEHREGDLIECITANCDVNIENCVFGNANSHLRFQSRGKFVMKNCYSELPVFLTGDASYWFESGPLTDLTVENCRFIGERGKIAIKSEVLPTEAMPYYHHNLKFLNNEFETELPLKGGYVKGIVFKGNKNTLGLPMTVELTNCLDVEADNCSLLQKTEEKKELGVN